MYRVTNHGGGSDGSGKNKFRVEMRVACSVRNTAEHGHESRSRRKPDADADADLLPGCSSALVNVHLKIVGRRAAAGGDPWICQHEKWQHFCAHKTYL